MLYTSSLGVDVEQLTSISVFFVVAGAFWLSRFKPVLDGMLPNNDTAVPAMLRVKLVLDRLSD